MPNKPTTDDTEAEDRAVRVKNRADALLSQWQNADAGPGTDEREEHFRKHAKPHPRIVEFTPLENHDEEQDAIAMFREAAGLPAAPRSERRW